MKSRAERACQFLPYASLRGFDSVVERKRAVNEPRRELAPDAEEEIARRMALAQTGDTVRVCYYRSDRYITVVSHLLAIDTVERVLKLGDGSVPVDDIFSFDIIRNL